MTTRLKDNLYFDGGIKAGLSENKITMTDTGVGDTFSFRRWSAYGTLFGDVDVENFMSDRVQLSCGLKLQCGSVGHRPWP